MIPHLPKPLAEIDLDEWECLTPDDLLLRRNLVYKHPGVIAAGRALRYARAGSASYDEIGYRMLAATPQPGPIPLQTLPRMRREREKEARQKADSWVGQIRSQQPSLRHRSIELPQDGRFRFQVEGTTIMFARAPDKSERPSADDVWWFSLSHPPAMLLHNARDDDLPLIASQNYQLDLPGACWLPLKVLIAHGRFKPMQEWAADLARQTAPGHYYCFLSHRWLTPTHPDPEGEQARLVAWQFVSHLCDAVRIAYERGLTTPRRINPYIGFPVGISGSDLAESLLVNVVRPALDQASVEAAIQEVKSIDKLTEDSGAQVARRDAGLTQLAELLEARPILQALAGRVLLWYDFGCLPQAPRSESDEVFFRKGLESLTLFQVLGRTAVLLNEPEDYLSRAWCTLEALVTDSLNLSPHLLLGSRQATEQQSEQAGYFGTVLADRPHLLWRGLLDTELFEIQNREACMERLGLNMTETSDLPYLYGRLQSLGAPQKIHTDASQLVTGAYPVPADSQAALIMTGLGRVIRENPAKEALTLDWTAALRLATGWDPEIDRVDTVPPSISLESNAPGGDSSELSAHVAVIASCEGEAILFSNWVLKHRSDLETLLNIRLSSLSWLASDIAPVGHIAYGSLQAVPVIAQVWVMIGMSVRYQHCDVMGSLIEAATMAQLPQVHVSIDLTEQNVLPVEPLTNQLLESERNSDRFKVVERDKISFPQREGGLFRFALPTLLFETKAPDGG